MKTMPELLKFYRMRAMLKQKDIAEATGYAASYVCTIERNGTNNAKYITAFSDATNLSDEERLNLLNSSL